MRTPVSLWVFTILTGAAAGFGLAAALLMVTGGAGGLVRDSLTAALVLTVLGGAAAALHLERPAGGHRVLRRWRTSWLSREVLAVSIFGALVAVALAAVLDGNELAGWAIWAIWAAALAGAGAVAVTGALYGSIRAIRGWHGPLTIQVLLGSGLASGLAVAGTLGAALGGGGALAGVRLLFLAAAGLTGASLVLCLARQGSFRPVPGLGRSEAPFPWLPSPVIRLQDRGTTFWSTHINPQLGIGPRRGRRSVPPLPFSLLGGLGIPLAAFLFLAWTLPGLHPAIAGAAAAGATALLFLGVAAERLYFFGQANHLSGVWAE